LTFAADHHLAPVAIAAALARLDRADAP
jgi:hypothetical protein